MNQPEFCDLSLEDYLCLANQLIASGGPMWECMVKNDTTFKAIHDTISSYAYDLNQFVCKAAQQANPCTADCKIDDWLEIYGVLECLNDDQKTLDIVCKLYQSRGIFNCETVQCLAEIEGFTVLECVCPTDTFEQPVDRICNSGLGGVLPFLGDCISEHNLECERNFADFPCVNCCQLDIMPGEPIDPEDYCNLTRNLGGCACPKPKAFSLPFLAEEETQTQLCQPWTIELLIEGSNPCSFFQVGSQTGNLSLSDPDNEFSICLIEKLKPAHICIKYKFQNDCLTS